MKMNNQMKEKLFNLKSDSKNLDVFLTISLFNPEFVEWDGCVFVNLLGKLKISEEKFMKNEMMNDRTELETFKNEILLIDVFPELEDDLDFTLEIGVKLIEVWGRTLKCLFPEKNFCLFLSHSDFGSTVNFYTLRENDVPWIDMSDLEKYADEALLVELLI